MIGSRPYSATIPVSESLALSVPSYPGTWVTPSGPVPVPAVHRSAPATRCRRRRTRCRRRPRRGRCVLLQRRRHIQQAGFESDGACVCDPLHQEVVGVIERGQDAGVQAGRGAIARAGCPTAEKLVGPLGLYFWRNRGRRAAGCEVGARRPNRASFQGLVHALVGAVLLRGGRQDPLVLIAEAEPPHVEGGEPMQRGGGESDAVVGPHRPAARTRGTGDKDGPHAERPRTWVTKRSQDIGNS